MRRRIKLETYHPRSGRLYRTRAERRHRLLTAAIVVTALAAIAGAAWAITARLPLTLPRTRTAAEKPAAKPAASNAASATTGATAGSPARHTGVVATLAPSAVATTSSASDTITIAAAGDMIFDRNVSALIRQAGGAAPLAEVAQRLAAADLAIANLESPLSDRGTRAKGKDVTFRGLPSAIEGLKLAGFDALSMANNHVLDYGPDALADTVDALDAAGIAHSGAGANQDAAWAPASVNARGAKVAYLAYSHIVPAGFIAQPNRAGLASGRWDAARVMNAVREAKKTNDYVIVSFHWGVEYQDNANAEQRKWAHDVIDAGADMVLAHHPHVIQGVEFYQGKLIAYSLGDFVFDHYSRKTGEAFILEAELGPDGTPSATAVPVYLDKYGRPEYVTGAEARTILDRLATISRPYGTTVQIDGDVARITP